MKIFKIVDYEILYETDSLKNAIKKLGETEYKVLFILNEKEELSGVLTDGDIRRYISSKNDGLEKKVEELMNKTPKYAFHEEYEKNKYNLDYFSKYKVNYLPIIDEQKKIQFVLHIDINFQLKTKMNNKVVIMAGGKGTRLLPLTRVVPKPLVPFKDKTIIEKIMEQFIDSGFDEFYLTVNYKKEMIKEYLNELNYNTKYIEEENFLGTAGSIGLLYEKEFNKSFFVTNCDILLNIDFLEPMMIHEKENIDITIFASLENNDISYGVVEIDNDGNYIRIKEKPNSSYLANTGIYILKPKIINIVKKNEVLDMPDLIQRAKNKGMKIKIFTVPHKMTDVGQWEYYKKFIDFNR